MVEEVWLRVSDLYDERWEAQYTVPSKGLFWSYWVANLVFLEHLRGKRHVLEVGCGTGGESVLLGEHVLNLVATDVSRRCLRFAKRKLRNRGLYRKVDLVTCDGGKLPFIEACFDGLASRGDVFFYLVPQDRAVLEFKRVLREGSAVVLEMWNGMQQTDEIGACFSRKPDSRVSYVQFSFKRDGLNEKTEYYLRLGGELSERIERDPKFQEKGMMPTNLQTRDITAATDKIVHHPPTCVFTPEGLRRLFKDSGFKRVEVSGDGVLSRIHLRNPDMAKMMERFPRFFVKLEKELVGFFDPDKTPTLILHCEA